MCAGLLFKYVKERNYLIYLGIDDRIILKKLLKKWEWTAGTKFVCVRVWSNIGLLRTR